MVHYINGMMLNNPDEHKLSNILEVSEKHSLKIENWIQQIC